MLTKAIILNKLVDDNHYLIRIPILETPEDTEISKIEAILAHTPGIVQSYKENDIVIIGFEEHSPDKPVILGKLFTNEKEEARGFAKLDSLEVKNLLNIPNNIIIGDKEFKNVSEMIEHFQDVQDSTVREIDIGDDKYFPVDGVVTLPEGGGGTGDGVTNVFWDYQNEKLVQTKNGTNSDIVTLSVLTQDCVPTTLSVFDNVNLKTLSISEQNSAYLYVDNNGVPSKVNANNLDYSKLTVFERNDEDLTKIREKDFMFTED